jgi:coproporphyrinogen III oxidase-like Fe-S oxidoreductase
VDGFDLKEFASRIRTTVNDLAGESQQRHLSGRSLQNIDDHLRLTREGRFIADSVVTDFLA